MYNFLSLQKWCRTRNIYTLYSLCPRAIKIGYNSLHNKSSNLWPIFRRTSWIDPGKLYHLINFSKNFDGIIYFQTRGLFRSKQGLQLKVALFSDEYRAWKKHHLKEFVLIWNSCLLWELDSSWPSNAILNNIGNNYDKNHCLKLLIMTNSYYVYLQKQ